MYRGITWKRKKYLQICRIIDAIDAKGNFCGIKNGTCNGCFGYRSQLCCNGCNHLSATGCTVDSIMCKISFCYMGSHPEERRLVKTPEQWIVAARRRKVVALVLSFCNKNGIPCYPFRWSIEEQFAKITK